MAQYYKNVSHSLVTLPSYNCDRQDRSSHTTQPNVKGRGGGLLIFIKKTHPYIRTIAEYNQINKHIVQLWVKIEKPGGKHYVYRPPSGTVEDFIKEGV